MLVKLDKEPGDTVDKVLKSPKCVFKYDAAVYKNEHQDIEINPVLDRRASPLLGTLRFETVF